MVSILNRMLACIMPFILDFQRANSKDRTSGLFHFKPAYPEIPPLLTHLTTAR
jgi:hypothetical protein